MAALLGYHERAIPEIEHEDLADIAENELNVFTNLRLTDDLRELILRDANGFSKPILDPSATRDQIGYIERMQGKGDEHAVSVAAEIVKDMQLATQYPPEVADKPAPDELVGVLDDLVSHISLRKEEDEFDID